MLLKLRNKTIVCFATLIFILISITTVSAIPLTPMLIQGDVTIDGNPAPAGTVVTAEMEGELVDSYTVQSTGQYMLRIPGESSDADKLIEFFVNGDRTDMTRNWEPGAIVTIDLAISTDDSLDTQSSSASSSYSSFNSDTDIQSENSASADSPSDEPSEPETKTDEQENISDNGPGISDTADNSSSSKAIPGFSSLTVTIGLIILCIGANRNKKE
ncbi:hypothetical protein [Methanolobus psychrotolerans]|uniref:hypothetical protein n=1 Tax=Methanolobus psychrotolerans TaxID=1874706 RepID=UPI000B917CCA|nr:hypothetical protein [Methanolobus psychrotolerans]